MKVDLPTPAEYLPFLSGKYDVRPGLHRFGHDFGNGAADCLVFQIDSQLETFRAAKLDARRRQFSRHVLRDRYADQTAAAVTRFIVEHLVREHPRWFDLQSDPGGQRLTCILSGETLGFDPAWQLDPAATRSQVAPPYADAWDAVACQLQEDLAVTCSTGPDNWVAALHVCLPSHWSPEEKLGRDFVQVHAPVPGMEPEKWKLQKFIDMMVGATDGRVRFVWGVQWDERLNRHPALDEADPAAGRFDPDTPRAFVRVERQTIWGLPEVGASLFTIRPYLIDAREIQRHPLQAAALAAGIESMSPASLRYKGLSIRHTELVEWLRRPADCPTATQTSNTHSAGS